MKKIRQGNTIIIRWNIKTNGEDVSLEGRDLRLYAQSGFYRLEVKNWVAEGCELIFKIEGRQLNRCGRYDVILVENAGNSNQAATDECGAFEVVAKSCMAGGSDEEGLAIEHVSLSSELCAVVGVSTKRVSISFSPYGSNESYSLGEVSGELFEKFFDEIPESTWMGDYGYYYYYGDMGQDENFSGIGEWDDTGMYEEEEEVTDGEVSS